MRELSDLLGIGEGQTVSIVGCGGKTSTLVRLAEEWRDRRVLVSTTTKMGRREVAGADHLYTTPDQWRSPEPGPGIHAAGDTWDHKLRAIAPEELERLRRGFDAVFLECDGSRRLPLKGWRPDEPVVPPFTDLTVGVAVVWPLGRFPDDTLVFQPRLFYDISGARADAPLTIEQLACAIAHPRGLFQGARGRRALLINQIEADGDRAQAQNLLHTLPRGLVDVAVAVSLREKTFARISRG